MSNLFDDLKAGLQEAIDYERGNTKARTVTYTHPTGQACRLLSILETNKQDNFDFVSVKITN